MSITTTAPSRHVRPELALHVSRLRVALGHLHTAGLPAFLAGLVLVPLWLGASGDGRAHHDEALAMVGAPLIVSLAFSLGYAFLAETRGCLWLRNGVIHVGAYGQVDPRKHVAAVDRLDRETTRWWDPLARLFGQRPLRQHGRRTLWVPVAWISRDELDAFLDEAERIAARG